MPFIPDVPFIWGATPGVPFITWGLMAYRLFGGVVPDLAKINIFGNLWVTYACMHVCKCVARTHDWQCLSFWSSFFGFLPWGVNMVCSTLMSPVKHQVYDPEVGPAWQSNPEH